MIKQHTFFFSFLLIIFPAALFATTQTVLVFEVLRHGARNALLEDKQGKLTDYGRIQAYLLGQELKYRYSVKENLISQEYDSSEFRIITSPKGRTVETARWHMAGFYPSFEENTQEKVRVIQVTSSAKGLPPLNITNPQFVMPKEIRMFGPALQDIKLTGEPEKKDWFFHSYKLCSKAQKLKKKAKESPEYEVLAEKYADTWSEAVKLVKKKINQDSKLIQQFDPDEPNIKKIGKLLDYYNCYLHKDKDVSDFSDSLLSELRQAKLDWVQNLEFGSDFVRKISVTPMFSEMIEIITNKFYSSDTENNDKITDYEKIKYIVYSCHDRNQFLTLVNLLTKEEYDNLGLKGLYQPFSTVLLFEILEDQNNGNYYVQLKYNNQIIQMSKCQDKDKPEFCSLKLFVKLLNQRIIHQEEEECESDI